MLDMASGMQLLDALCENLCSGKHMERYVIILSVWVRFYLYYSALILFNHILWGQSASNTTNIFINVLLLYIVKI